MKKRFYLLAVVAALGGGFVTSTPASVIYSTLGPVGDFDTNNSVQIGSLANISPTIAESFVSPVDATAGSVTFALSAMVIGGPADVAISIRSNTAAGPGGVVGQFVAERAPFGPQLMTFTCLRGVPLVAGTEYWLSVTDTGPDQLARWFLNDQGIDNVSASLDGSGTWTLLGSGTTPAFELDTIPEPSSATLWAGAIAAAYLWRRRVRR